MIKELVSLFKPKATDIPVELIEQFAKEYFASQAAVHNGDIPFQNYDFSLHFLSINAGKRMSSAKVILTFITPPQKTPLRISDLGGDECGLVFR